MEEAQLEPSRRRMITWRSVGLGLLLALVVVCLSPYNDYVVNNSFLVGSYFPPIVTMGLFAIVLLINGPLHKFAPRAALSQGELAIVMAMALVACALPGQGLMRSFVPMPVAPFYFTDKADYHDIFQKMNLPHWLWAVDNPDDGSRDRAFTAFYSRLQQGEPMPWRNWIKPLIGWGTFAAAFLTSLFSLACILRFQWTTNERLAFPIAQLQGMLIAPPKPGRAFNDLFSNRGFWIAVALVVVIESSAVLHLYFPATVPAIPFQYDFTKVLSDQPWTDLPIGFKQATIYFSLVGLSYFTTTRVSFSLWATWIGVVVIRWVVDPGKSLLTDGGLDNQMLGAAFVIMASVLWIGRGHWAVVIRSLFGKRRPDDAQGAFLTYRVAMIGLILGAGGMFAWLLVVMTEWSHFSAANLFSSAALAAAWVVMILMAHVLTARVVAETGLAFIRIPVEFNQMLRGLPANWLTPKQMFFYGTSHYGYMQAARESELVFAMHGLNVVNDAAPAKPPHKGVASLLISTVAVCFITCFIASLYCYYFNATPLSADDSNLLNKYGLQLWPQIHMVDNPTSVARGFYPAKPNNVWVQLPVGIAITVFLQVMSWRFAAWPLLPVGYLMCGNSYMNIAWLSILIGWLLKSVILKFGGAKLFNDLKPFFVGLIFGEALAIAIWLVITLVLALSGDAFYVVRFLPQ
ncbi:MAG: hypothetical protein QM754_09960 [Tepidisphaeraceae bacterium]